ncbi:MAG: 3-dehydroquinate synthase [Gemmatimonadota bacterium]
MSQRSGNSDPLTVYPTDSSDARPYDVWIQPGLLAEAGSFIGEACPAHRYAVISDSQVSDVYAKPLLAALASAGLEAELFKFAAGEWNKTREVWSEVTNGLLRAGVGRDAAIIALGGGVVGDLAGFIAATYMRGIRIAQIPTSLLAMVDSSVGGKTGLDTPAGKNLVGAFHQPSVVLVDPMLLRTLPNHQLAAGLSEALKHGLITDAEYFGQTRDQLDLIFGRDSDALCRLVRRSIEIKADVVSQDTHEVGYRRILNFGHTIAHALETVSGYGLLHGEAVAIGLWAEAAIGETLGVTAEGTAEEIRDVLVEARLPVELDSEIETEKFFEALSRDKKRLGDEARYSLISEIGRVAGSRESGWTQEVSNETVQEVLFG